MCMSKRTTRTVLLALACVLAGRLAVSEAGPGKTAQNAAQLTRVTYPVADLVVPIEDHDGKPRPPVPPRTTEDKLMELVQSVVAPSSWKGQGGSATVQYYPLGMALVINQTAEAHAAIADLLKALRRMQEVEVAVELRLVQMSPEMADDFRTNGGFQSSDADGNGMTAFFTDKELHPWMRLIQRDPAGTVLMAPRITTFSGQQAVVQVTNQERYVTEYRVVRKGDEAAVVPHHETVELGPRCILRPTVSADRRTVRLELDFRYRTRTGSVATMPVVLKLATADGEGKEFRGLVQQPNIQTLTAKQTCGIPDGRTMVIGLGQISEEVRSEIGPPVLRDIPFLGRCFRTVGFGREDTDVFLFVTPRIIINEEAEEPACYGELPSIPRP
jgi:type II secretory pathway component GspD/PulD (secretin)